MLERTGLSDVAHDRIRSLSGGTLRRVALAQALIGLPELLVLDEPLSSLDTDQRNNVVAIIGERAADATLIVATHHADEVAGVCNQAIVLHRGHVTFAGPPPSSPNRQGDSYGRPMRATPGQTVDLSARGAIAASAHDHRPVSP